MSAPIVRDVMAAIAARDWDALTLPLHPYLHWTCQDGRTIRGRRNVLAHLAGCPTALPLRAARRAGLPLGGAGRGAPAA
ncbi:MAG: hypothetical protein M3Q48_07680 [Actinomycetota bacterium]|nr:hypothetical protein [Actinomycetota bacterium]